MKSSSFLLIATALLVSVIHALILEKRDDPAVFKIPLQKKTNAVQARAFRDRRLKRSGVVGPITDSNYHTDLLYLVQLYVGTPPQAIMVQLDTGSSDLVVETDSSDLCSQPAPNPCTIFGAYDANSSSTYQYVNSDFSIQYAGGDGATGDYALDTVKIGSAVVPNLRLGIMYKTTVVEGIIGVSFTDVEAQPTYNNLPILLVQQGFIASRAFSLWTNDDRSSSGTLLFGGVDTDKYYGSLVTINLVPSDTGGGVSDFTIPLIGVTGTDINGNPVTFQGSTTTVLLDSGTTLTDLPDALTSSIWTFVGATPIPGQPSQAKIPCSAASSAATINFRFNGITIVVPMSQLVIFPDGSGTCEFGIGKAGSGTIIIGDTVLSSMYVVYDLDNEQVSLAPTVFNTQSSNIVQIMAGPGGVPHHTGVATTTPGPTTTTKAAYCSQDNCLRGLQNAGAASAFCSTYTRVGGAIPTFATGCSSSTARFSSGCTCLLATMPTATPTPYCYEDNCLRAIEHATAKSFCKTLLAGGVVATPTDIVKQCSTLSSRVSSGCSCYTATAV